MPSCRTDRRDRGCWCVWLGLRGFRWWSAEMPTTRTRRRRSFRPAVSATQGALPTDQPVIEESGISQDFERWCFNWDNDGDPPWREKSGRQLWAEHREAVLTEWIAENPGTRPS